MNEYKELRRTGALGFAHAYLDRWNKESKSDDQIDIKIYTKLVQLDLRLGTTASEQFTICLNYTTRSDIIKVLIVTLNRINPTFAYGILKQLNFEILTSA